MATGKPKLGHTFYVGTGTTSSDHTTPHQDQSREYGLLATSSQAVGGLQQLGAQIPPQPDRADGQNEAMASVPDSQFSYKHASLRICGAEMQRCVQLKLTEMIDTPPYFAVTKAHTTALLSSGSPRRQSCKKCKNRSSLKAYISIRDPMPKLKLIP